MEKICGFRPGYVYVGLPGEAAIILSLGFANFYAALGDRQPR